MEKYDVVVIGAGPGGYPAAIRAAQLGASVAVVEREKLGGTCLNWGCIPTKSLIAGADLCHQAANAAALGVRIGEVRGDYRRMIARKNEIVDGLREGVTQLLNANGVKVLEGVASFTARNRLAVAGRDGTAGIEAGRVIVATGSEPLMPASVPRHRRITESRGFLDRQSLPASLIVLGGGVIGCEFACLAARLGVEVTIVELLEDILPMLDPDLRREVRRHMERRLGVKVLTGTPLEDIRAGRGGVRGRAGDREVKADHLLVAVGRIPLTRGLGLAKAGVNPSDRGAIPIDAFCQTSVAGIYAVGDVTEGTTQLAHAATSQGITAAENACRSRRRPAETVIPCCIFTSPEIGSVGLTETTAGARGVKVRVGKFMLGALGKARAAGHPEGFVKLIADAGTDQLLGAHAVGAAATELIAEAALAVRAELTAAELGRTIHCHPTLSESWLEAAHAVHGACIHAPPRRR